LKMGDCGPTDPLVGLYDPVSNTDHFVAVVGLKP